MRAQFELTTIITGTEVLYMTMRASKVGNKKYQWTSGYKVNYLIILRCKDINIMLSGNESDYVAKQKIKKFSEWKAGHSHDSFLTS